MPLNRSRSTLGADPRYTPRRRPLPERPPVTTPVARGGHRRPDAPMRDPQGVAVVGEPRRVTEVRAPEMRARVDHRAHAGPAVHASQPRAYPVRQLSDGEAVVLLDVQRRKHVTGCVLCDGDEVVGLSPRIACGEADLRPVIGTDDQPVRGGLGQILREPGIDVRGPARRSHDHEPRLRRRDRGPVDVALPQRDVDPRHPLACGHGARSRDDGEDRRDQRDRADDPSARTASTHSLCPM